MTKNFLFPKAKEVLIGPKSDTTFFEVFHYPPDKAPESGHLFVIAQILTDDESLSYVPNLLASFIRREYFNASVATDIQKQFEKALKKANELIFDLAENNNVKLNMAIAVVAGEQLLTSRLGRAKLLLARGESTTDVFSNVDLFGKIVTGEKEFSNIINGKVQEDDKLFFYIPNRRLSAREASLKTSLVKMNQDEFFNYLNQIGTASDGADKSNLTCCAVHINLSKQEEIIPTREDGLIQLTSRIQTPERPAIIATPNPAEIDRVPQRDVWKKLKASLVRSLPFSPKTIKMPKKSYLIWATAIVIILLFLGIKWFIGNQKHQADLKKALNRAEDLLRVSDSETVLGNNKKARDSLQEATATLKALGSNKEKDTKLSVIDQKLNVLDKLDPKKAEPIFNFSQPLERGFILSNEEGVFVLNQIGSIEKLDFDNASSKEIAKLTTESPIIQASTFNKVLYFYDGQRVLWQVSPITKKVSSLTIASSEPVRDLKFYQDNLYLLSSTITKISDVTKGQTQQQKWLSSVQDFDGISISIGQNIFVLTKDGRLFRYFKGARIDTRNVEFSYSSSSILYSIGADFVVLDVGNKKARLMDSAGILKRTWNLSTDSELLGGYFDSNTKALYLLTKDKLWRLGIEI